MKIILDLIKYISMVFRSKRICEFINLMKPNIRTVILDVGGEPSFWHKSGFKGKIIFINLHPPSVIKKLPLNWEYIQGDARNLCFKNKSIDIIFSNSVIEHINNQKLFAHEVSRVGKRYWLQTPNKYFPIEPHFLIPGLQFLSRQNAVKIIKIFSLFLRNRFANYNSLNWFKIIDDITLLSSSDLNYLFPDGKLVYERFLLLKKSLIIYRN